MLLVLEEAEAGLGGAEAGAVAAVTVAVAVAVAAAASSVNEAEERGDEGDGFVEAMESLIMVFSCQSSWSR